MTTQLGSLFEFMRNGLNVRQSQTDGGLPITRIETIADGVVDPGRVGFAGLRRAEAERWLLKPGDILFSHINSADLVGKCAVYRGKPQQLVHGMNLLCLRPRADVLVPDYGLYLLRSGPFRARLSNSVKRAVNQASVSIGDLKKIPVDVPSLEEQHRVIGLLERVARLRETRHRTLEMLDVLAEALFVEQFGDPLLNLKRWPRMQIGQLGTVVTGNTPSRANESYYGDAIEWIKPDNLADRDYYATEASEFLSEAGKSVARVAPPNAILVTCIAGSPASIGNAAMTNREVAFNQQINAFIPRDGDPHFYYAQLRLGRRLVQAASTGGMKGMVSKSRFQEIELIAPPVGEQGKFGRAARTIESLREAHQSSLSDLRTLFASFEQRAFQPLEIGV
jgi:type I restriction enzyme, S subunit